MKSKKKKVVALLISFCLQRALSDSTYYFEHTCMNLKAGILSVAELQTSDW